MTKEQFKQTLIKDVKAMAIANNWSKERTEKTMRATLASFEQLCAEGFYDNILA